MNHQYQFDAATNTMTIVEVAKPFDIAESITLNDDEMREAGHFAVDRRFDSRHKQSHNAVKSKSCTLNTELDQVCAVLAAAKACGKRATLNRGTYEPDRVGNWRIRHTSQPKGRLRVYDDQPASEICVLVVGRDGKFTLKGWMRAGDARRIGFKEDLNGSGKTCWCVPQNALKPMKELQ